MAEDGRVEFTVSLPRLTDTQLAMLREICDGAAERAHSSIWLYVEGKGPEKDAAALSFYGLVERVAYSRESCDIRLTMTGQAFLDSQWPSEKESAAEAAPK